MLNGQNSLSFFSILRIFRNPPVSPVEKKALDSGLPEPQFLKSFPDELKILILSFLSPKDLAVLSLVSKECQVLANDDTLWKQLFSTIGGQLTWRSDVMLFKSKLHQLTDEMKVVCKQFPKEIIDAMAGAQVIAALPALPEKPFFPQSKGFLDRLSDFMYPSSASYLAPGMLVPEQFGPHNIMRGVHKERDPYDPSTESHTPFIAFCVEVLKSDKDAENESKPILDAYSLYINESHELCLDSRFGGRLHENQVQYIEKLMDYQLCDSIGGPDKNAKVKLIAQKDSPVLNTTNERIESQEEMQESKATPTKKRHRIMGLI